MRLLFLTFLFLVSFMNFSYADTNALLKDITSTANSHYSYDRTIKHPYECGIPPTQLTAPFFHNINIKDVQQINFNFQCPTIDEIQQNNPTLLTPLLKTKTFDEIKKMNFSVTIKNINFNSGSYICSYNFGDYSFNLIEYLNCDYYLKSFEKLFPPKVVNSFDKLKVPAVFANGHYQIGNYKFEEFPDLKKLYNSLWQKTEKKVLDVAEYLKEHNVPTINLHSIDSHTHYERTFPAVLTSLLTFNVNYFQNGKNLIDKLGRININLPTITNAKSLFQFEDATSPSTFSFQASIKNKFKNNKKLLKYVENRDKYVSKAFWGFYYYFFKNIEIGFKQIIEIIFFFGAFGLFGFAIFSKKTNIIGTEIQQKFQFDFTKKFLGIATAFFIFTAPIMSSNNINIDKDFLYNNDNFSTELASSYTPFQGLMQYSINLGNYFGNILADYGTFAYLTYLKYSVNYGIKPENNLIELNMYFKNFYWQFYNLQREYDFVKTLCVMSYPTIYNKYNTFPKDINPDKIEISNVNQDFYPQFLLWKNFHFTKIDYQTCVTMNNKLNYDSIMLIKGISNFTNYFNKHLKVIGNPQKMLENQKAFNKLFKEYIKIHNNFGWITTISLPMFQLIIKSKELYNNLGLDNLRNEIAKQSSKYYTFKTENAYGEKINTSIEDEQISNKDKINSFINVISKYSIYTIIPGFNTLTTNIAKFMTDVIDTGFGISRIIKASSDITGFSGKLLSLFLGKKLIFLLAYILAFFFAIFLFKMIIFTINFIVISFALLFKITFYYFEIFLTYLISFAVALWSLTTNPQRAWEAWSNFIFQIAKLTFMPILIVLTVFAIIIVNKIVFFLFGVLSFIIADISLSANSLSFSYPYHPFTSQFFSHLYIYMAIHSFLGSSHLILTILLILVDLLIIFKFSDWAFEIFGKRDGGGSMSSEVKQFTETIKQKYSGGML